MTLEGRPAGATGVLVIGYGNTLRRDDGVGQRAADLLAADPRMAGVDVRSQHQLTPELALDMSQVALVVLVDADMRAKPGAVAVQRVTLDAVAPGSRPEPGATSHHVGVAELLALAAQFGGAAPRAVVVGVGVEDVEMGEELSVPVAAALPEVVETVVGLTEEHRAGGKTSG